MSLGINQFPNYIYVTKFISNFLGRARAMIVVPIDYKTIFLHTFSQKYISCGLYIWFCINKYTCIGTPATMYNHL